MNNDKLLNARQAARLLNRSHEWVYTQIRRGLIPVQLIERIGLTRPPAIRIEESVIQKLARRLRRVDQARQERRREQQTNQPSGLAPRGRRV
jgi:hypothetical protein